MAGLRFAHAAGGSVFAGAMLIAWLMVSYSATATTSQPPARERGPSRREFSVQAQKYVFAPSRIYVTQDDIVKVTFLALDIPHSFTIDAYRIAKRSNPDRPVTFEFHAIQPGTFPIYCNLTIDEECRVMHGELVVKPR